MADEERLVYENRIASYEEERSNYESKIFSYEKERFSYESRISSYEIKISELEDLLRQEKEKNKYLQKQLYAPKSEQKKAVNENTSMDSLFNEAELESTEKPTSPEKEEEKETITYSRKKKKQKDNFEKITEGLEHEAVINEPSPDELLCSDCGSEMNLVDTKLVRSELIRVPERYYVKDYYQKVYQCTKCKSDINKKPVFFSSYVPKSVLSGSLASPSVVADIMIKKYEMAIPICRQVKEIAYYGAFISRANASNWVVKCSTYWLEPLYDRLKEHLLKEPLIHADETTVQVMREEKRSNKQKSYMWLYAAGEYSQHPVRIFKYRMTRAGEHPQKFLTDFSGYLVTDGYIGYSKLSGVTRCMCWAHARRYFVDALDACKVNPAGSASNKVIHKINRLFEYEQIISTIADSEERRMYRLRLEKPVIDGLFEYLNSIRNGLLPKSPLAKAVNYAIDNEQYLRNYLLDGICCLSNNLAERSIRPFTVGRKNWLVAGSPKGATASSVIYSIIETCKANKINPRKYLEKVFTELPNREFRFNKDILDEYMPWSNIIQESCR